MNIDKNKITNMFFDFEKAGITYALLRDVDKILPELYSSDKDIDIIIRPESRKQFIQYLHSNKWKRVEHELIHLLTRCIFDKKNFNIAYQNRIEELLEKVNIETIKIELNKVFFKFTDNLLDLLIKKKYNCIIKDYLTFKEY